MAISSHVILVIDNLYMKSHNYQKLQDFKHLCLAKSNKTGIAERDWNATTNLLLRTYRSENGKLVNNEQKTIPYTAYSSHFLNISLLLFTCFHIHFHPSKQYTKSSPLRGVPVEIKKKNRINFIMHDQQLKKISLTWYKDPMVADVGGITLLTKKNKASSGLRWILLRIRK